MVEGFVFFDFEFDMIDYNCLIFLIEGDCFLCLLV